MRYRLFVSLVFLPLVFGLPAHGQSDSLSLYIPEPEEIQEAFSDGLIDYEDYAALLEISRKGVLTTDDSLFLLSFPDLIAGFSSNMIIPQNVPSRSMKNSAFTPARHRWRGEVLTRQHTRLRDVNDSRYLTRVNLYSQWILLNGEYERAYSGDNRWNRRQCIIKLSSGRSASNRVTIGNYKTRFGMGLMYGYHGQLFSKDSDNNGMESFIYPRYGGGNGVFLCYRGNILLIDADRNAEFSKLFGGVSVPIQTLSFPLVFSLGSGRIKNRLSGDSQSARYLSLSGRCPKNTIKAYEFSIARYDGQIATAVAGQIRWQDKSVTVNALGWRYDADYPAFFSGGPSAKRTRTIVDEDIDFTYRERRTGESGVVINTVNQLSMRTSMAYSLGYSHREISGSCLEGKVGVTFDLSDSYKLSFTMYERVDSVSTDSRIQKRLQGELKRWSGGISSRFVFGYRHDKKTGRDDFLLLCENRIDDRFGKLYVLCKFDRIIWSDLKNRYMYVALSHESVISGHVRSYIKFSYRYADTSNNNYGTIRWDITCAF